jgi:CRISPR-associated protein Csd1
MSYGWKGNQNAPISRKAAEACSTALERLLDDEYPNPRITDQVLPSRNIRISSNTAVCYWAADSGGDDFCGAFAGLLDANPAMVKEMYHSLWRGVPPHIDDPTAFYALTLTGTQGRIIVRDWFESTVASVAENLALHFEDLRIARNTPKPKDRDLPPNFPLYDLLESIADPATNRKEGIPAPLADAFVRAALAGIPYPLAAMQKALMRYRLEIGNINDDKDGWRTKKWNDARVALIKAILNRRKRAFPNTTHYKEVQPEMDLNNNDQGYLLGRLMACIERMQQTALKNVNASVVDRFFSGASASPKSVFPRLMKNLRHHARKAKDDAQTSGTARWLESQVDEIVSRINDFPSHLSLDEQGLFIIGYHHQRNWFWTKKEDRDVKSASAAAQNTEI